MGNRRIGRKRLESVLKQLNATNNSDTGSRSGLDGFQMPAFEIQPSKYFGFFDDFLAVNGNVGLAVDGDMAQATAINYGVWTAVVDGTIKLDNSFTGGVVRFTGQTTDDDVSFLTALNSGFALDASSPRKVWFETRLKMSDATDSGMFVGLASDGSGAADATILDAAGALADGIGWQILDGQAAVTLASITAKNDAETVVQSSTSIVAATWINLSFHLDGTSAHFYINGTLSHSSTLTLPNDGTVIFPHLAFTQKDGDNDQMDVDYVRICQER